MSNMQTLVKKAFTVQEAATMISSSVSSLYKARQQNKIKFLKIGARTVVLGEEIDAFLRREQQSTAELQHQD